MKLTPGAHNELLRLLEGPHAHGYDGFALYFTNQSDHQPVDPQQPIWETVAQTGWKLTLVPVDHLPVENIQVVGGLRFFVGSDNEDHQLDFDTQTFRLDGAPVQLE